MPYMVKKPTNFLFLHDNATNYVQTAYSSDSFLV